MGGARRKKYSRIFKCSSCETILTLKPPYRCVRCGNDSKDYYLIPWYIKKAIKSKEVE